MDLERRSRDDALFYLAASWIPDTAIAYAAMRLGNEGWSTFWYVLIGLQCVYLFFWLKGFVWSAIVWKVWGRQREIERMQHFLANTGLPRPDTAVTSVDAYFATIQQDEDATCEQRIRAAEWATAIGMLNSRGLIVAMRLGSAWDEAFARFARRSSGA